jgi:hypothetical protein
MVFLTLAPIVFGVLVEPLGFIPACAVCVISATLASPKTGITKAGLVTIGLTLFCYVIFYIVLGLQLPAFGSAFGFL